MRKAMQDRHRPRYHFMPPANWMNDPNGLIQWQGSYHLFYQHNPNAAYWGDMHWGHAISPDLVHWQHLPIALAPTPGGIDHDGVWSGCAVNWDGTPTLVYTARLGKMESVCLATSRDGLRTWEKYPGNPVIAAPPEGLKTLGFRDPYVWRADGRWWMVLGSGIDGVGGAILLYTSPNLTEWQYLGQMITGSRDEQEPYWTGEMWECPNFFALGDRHVLLISVMDFHPPHGMYTLYFTGEFRENRFTPQTLAKLDGGDLCCYAPQAFRDEQGRRIYFGWSREMRSRDASVEAGWAGVMTLPRLLELGRDGRLLTRPVPEVDRLRGRERVWENLEVRPEEVGVAGLFAPDGLGGDCLELEAVFSLEGAQPGSEFGLLVRRSPQGEEQTEISFSPEEGQLVVDTLRSSLDAAVEEDVYRLPLDLAGEGQLRLRVYLDGSMLEVYANDRAVITARIYPQREDSLGVALFAEGGPARVERLRAWEMKPVW